MLIELLDGTRTQSEVTEAYSKPTLQGTLNWSYYSDLPEEEQK